MKPPRFWRSFRFRAILLASSLSTLLLVGFGVFAMAVITRISLDRMDSDILESARQYLRAEAGPRYWEDVEDTLGAIYGPDRVTLAVIARGNDQIFVSDNWPQGLDLDRFPNPAALPRPPRPPGPPTAREYFSFNNAGPLWRFCVVTTPGVTVVIGVDEARFREDIRQVRLAFLLVLPMGLLLTVVGGWFLTQRALRPLSALADVTERVTAQGLHERIRLEAQDQEFQRLIEVFNGMLERLDRSFTQATRFSADAAHELKTPMAVLQGELERGVQESSPGSDEQARYGRMLEQVNRLKGITRKLLLLATADAGQLQLKLDPFDLSSFLESAAEDVEIVAPHLRVKAKIQPGLGIMADGDLLRQLVQNLLTNATRYNIKNGKVELHLREFGEVIQLTVANSGPGIPPADRDRVFERFYRTDKARSRTKGGSGLGLSLAREIARAHGGDLFLEQTPPGLTAFTLELPNPHAVRTAGRRTLA